MVLANDLTVFTTILNYVNYSGDAAYLDTTIAGPRPSANTSRHATHWQSLVPAGQDLADYGRTATSWRCCRNTSTRWRR